MQDETNYAKDRQIGRNEALTLARTQLEHGTSRQGTIKKLMDRGLSESIAKIIVDQVESELTPDVSSSGIGPGEGNMVLGVVGGLAGALVGAVIWGLIAISSGYEIGFIAIGVGVLCGFGVLLLSRGGQGITYGLIASGCSLLGILLGKYIIYWDLNKEQIAKIPGSEGISIPLISFETFSYFFQDLTAMLSGHDVLWVILAIGAALKIATGSSKSEE